ncbi:hypothetical protein Tco_0524971 [Tanacetum coccineum]
METYKPLLKDADEHMYRSMIGSLMYLTSSRPYIIYLKGQHKLGLWYPRDSLFDSVAYIDSEYVGASLDRKSTTRGCQFLGCRLISWQCKKQIVVANSTTEAKYVAASMKNPVFYSKTKHIEIRHHFIRDSNEKKLIQMIKIHTDKNVPDLLTKAFDKGIGVNVGDSKLMLLGINLLLLEKVNAARHNLLLLVLQALVDGKKVIITETSIRRDLQLEDAEGIECLPNADIFKKLALMGYEKPSQKLTFYKAFFSPQWKFFIHTILQCLSAKSTAWNEFSGTMASAIICLATNQKFNFSKYIFESMVKNVDSSVKFLMYPMFVQVFLDKQVGDMSTHDEIFVTPSHTKKFNDPPLSRVNTLGSGEDRLKFKELMDLCSKLSDRVLDLEATKTAQVKEIAILKKREDASKQRRKIDYIDKDAEVTLVNETQGRYDDAQMFDTYVFNGEEVFVAEQSEKVVEEVVSTAEVSVAATITFRDPGESTTRTTLTPIPSNIKDKGKAKMIEPEKPLKKKEQIILDEELAFKLQAEEEEQARLAREKAEKVEEANISWDNVQAMLEADRLLDERLQAREQEELTDEEKARLFVNLLEKRNKHFAALRA